VFLEEHPSLSEALVALGPVDEQEKTWLIGRASAVVYPSVYEGFGLVPFESALSGVPCVFAPQSSLAEVAPEGTATILPWDPTQSAARAYALLSDPETRSRHVQALARAAANLTWASAARATVEVYGEAAASPVRDAATLSRDAVDRERRLTGAHEAVVRRLVGEREPDRPAWDAPREPAARAAHPKRAPHAESALLRRPGLPVRRPAERCPHASEPVATGALNGEPSIPAGPRYTLQ
jgi:hypothetical protein